MSKIPEIEISGISAYTGQQNRTGLMCNAYSPLKNLEDENQTLGDFTTEKLNFDLLHPVDIILQDSYDGAVNMVLNDGKNVPRLINSRFSVVDENLFKIPVHTGHKNTNIYAEKTFKIDTSLKPIARKIPKIEYNGLTQFGGSLPCGAYTFYFKLADADGNESEILAESGVVQIYMGGTLYPDVNVRMGMEDENTGKSINFTLTNIDSGFDYVHVLYARSSSGNDQAAAETYHKVIFDYPVSQELCQITITGAEPILGISQEELYTDFADIESVKTQSVVNNVLFFGNVKKQEHDWDALRIASWKIGYTASYKSNIGSLTKDYVISKSDSEDEQGCYYNTYNSYYRVGYWPDEIYRFGIVYIFEDNSLSPVFNLQGCDLTKFELSKVVEFSKELLFLKFDDGNLKQWELSPEDYYFDKSIRSNSKGVIKFPKFFNVNETSGGTMTPSPVYIKFDLSQIAQENYDDKLSEDLLRDSVSEFFTKHKIKGYFFVRQKRIPTILAQGIAIGLTNKDNGALPVIKEGESYSILSFLQNNQLLLPEGRNCDIKYQNVKVNALLVPDSEISEATFNLLFVSNKYSLYKVALYYFDARDNLASVLQVFKANESKHKRKLTNVPEDTKTLTDGEIYFSTIAGNPSEPYKTADVNHVWNETAPQDLTTSTSLVRGNWGCFVGVGEGEEGEGNLSYGGVYNIKKENYYDDEEAATDLDFQLNMERVDSYSAICDRTEFDKNVLNISCYRGDCFLSLFTHRMFRNFIDPELPTNDKIVNPACWAQNYAVRCTAQETVSAEYNVYPESEGWWIDKNQEKYANEIAQAFEIREKSSESYPEWKWDAETQTWYKGDDIKSATETTKQIGGVDPVAAYINQDKLINIVKPAEQELTGVGGILKNIFKSSKWALRGLASINRADVNAVGLGQWITFPICSAKNLALRDIDYSNATELAAFNRKRSFYPLQKMDIHNPLRDSNVINAAAGLSLPHKKYYLIPDVPFIKLEYFTRVVNSLRDSANSITNEFKVMLETAYRDYTKIHGPITKLVPMGSKMLVVFHHGIGILSLNDSMSQARGPQEYLPVELSMVISPDFGSMWKDSIIETPKGVYGIDTVAKVIWKVVPGEIPSLQLISNFKILKFLNDSIDLSEFVTSPFVGRINVKSHYNAFKLDVIFTYYNDILYRFNDIENLSDYDITSDGYLLQDKLFVLDPEGNPIKGEKVAAYYDDENGELIDYSKQIQEAVDNNQYNSIFKWANGKTWSICFNEILEKFITFYDWVPVESENIDNIWFSFDREATNQLVDLESRCVTKKYIKPADIQNSDDGIYGGRDENYGQNAIDSTFNSTISVTYFTDDTQANILFEPITYNYKQNEKLVIGCYVKNGAKYKFGYYYGQNLFRNLRTLDLSEQQTGWKFVVVEIKDPNITTEITDIKLDVTLIGNYNNVNDFAISDLIYDNYVVNTTDVLEEVITPTTDLLPYYYTVRTLTDSLPLWKHGQAGLYDNADELKPTFWYGQQHEFNFEFVVRKDAMHKIFNNLLIISNKTEPHKFEFEVVGEAYDWHKYKPVLKWIADQVTVATDNLEGYETLLNAKFIEVLSHEYGYLKHLTGFPKIFGMKDGDYFEKLPYLKVTDACVPTLDPQIIEEKKGTKGDNIYLLPEQYTPKEGDAHTDNTVSCCLVYDKLLNEFRVHTELLGNDIRKYGRLRGNMLYLEDLWRVEIRPVAFKYAYLKYTIGLDGKRIYQIPKNGVPLMTKIQETRHRDKYVKIKVRYSGEDLAVIQAISTLFDYSYA